MEKSLGVPDEPRVKPLKLNTFSEEIRGAFSCEFVLLVLSISKTEMYIGKAFPAGRAAQKRKSAARRF